MRDRNFGRHPVTPSPRHPWRFLAAFLVLCPGFASAGTIYLGDPLIPTALGVGDTFHLAFVSTSTRNAIESDPATDDFGTWDALVNGDAAGSSLSGVGGYTWYAIVTTSNWKGSDASASPYAVVAPDHAVVSGPVYLLDGSKIADDYTDMWDDTIDHAFNVNQDGNTVTGSQKVWTGTNVLRVGGQEPCRALGGNLPDWGYTDKTDKAWLKHGNSTSGDAAKAYRVYALSEPLTIAGAIPEPGTIALLGMALLGLGFYVWRKRR